MFYRAAAALYMMSCNSTEHDMRVAALAIIGLIGLTTMSVPLSASPAGSVGREAGAASYLVQVAQGCGPGFHWVARHRNRYGAWVPGHCAKNIHT
jgi:hypothetical protein